MLKHGKPRLVNDLQESFNECFMTASGGVWYYTDAANVNSQHLHKHLHIVFNNTCFLPIQQVVLLWILALSIRILRAFSLDNVSPSYQRSFPISLSHTHTFSKLSFSLSPSNLSLIQSIVPFFVIPISSYTGCYQCA